MGNAQMVQPKASDTGQVAFHANGMQLKLCMRAGVS
jgi:hypothetical protein